MQRIVLLTVSILLLSIRTGLGDDKTQGKEIGSSAGDRPTDKVDGSVPNKPSGKPAGVVVPELPTVSGKHSVDEEAIRQTGQTYVAAFCRADAKSVVEHFTHNAEYVDEQSHIFHGRPAIEVSLKAFFAEFPDCKMELKIDSIRFVGPGVAIEDGSTAVTRSKGAEPVVSRYTVVHVKSSGQWLTASVRDFAPKPRRQHRAQLRQLEWMLGEWVHEGNDAVVVFSCRAVDNGTFLLRNFTIQIAGQDAISGSQRIGWDAQAGKLRTWIFDSEGGHSDGFWHRDGDSWVLKVTGVTADGQTASSTSLYSFVDPHTMAFQSVDHEVAGVELPDSAKVKIVRHPPRPE